MPKYGLWRRYSCCNECGHVYKYTVPAPDRGFHVHTICPYCGNEFYHSASDMGYTKKIGRWVDTSSWWQRLFGIRRGYYEWKTP